MQKDGQLQLPDHQDSTKPTPINQIFSISKPPEPMSTPFKNIAVVGVSLPNPSPLRFPHPHLPPTNPLTNPLSPHQAGGNLGPFIVRSLLLSNFAVTIIARPTSTSTFPPSVRTLKGEYTPEFLVSAFKGIDAVVLTVGGAALGEQKGMVDAAAKAGVRRIVPSEFGSVSTRSCTEIAAIACVWIQNRMLTTMATP